MLLSVHDLQLRSSGPLYPHYALSQCRDLTDWRANQCLISAAMCKYLQFLNNKLFISSDDSFECRIPSMSWDDLL